MYSRLRLSALESATLCMRSYDSVLSRLRVCTLVHAEAAVLCTQRLRFCALDPIACPAQIPWLLPGDFDFEFHRQWGHGTHEHMVDELAKRPEHGSGGPGSQRPI